MPRLSELEAVALSVGVEPKHLETTVDEDDEFLKYLGPSIMFAKFRRLFHLQQHRRTVSCKELLDWFSDVGLEVRPKPPEMLDRFHGSKKATASNNKRPDKRELDSVVSLFTTMAIEQFGYDPTSARSPTVKEIQDLAASLGLSMQDDTIRHHLRHGSKFIYREWKPHSR